MFVDASVLVAILAKEDESFDFGSKLDTASTVYISAVVQYEAVSVASRIYAGTRNKPFKPKHFDSAVSAVARIIEVYDMQFIPIGSNESKLAFQALGKYGRGSGHRAKLNMGDCFSYACAKAHNLPLLLKGNDFIHTDIEQA